MEKQPHKARMIEVLETMQAVSKANAEVMSLENELTKAREIENTAYNFFYVDGLFDRSISEAFDEHTQKLEERLLAAKKEQSRLIKLTDEMKKTHINELRCFISVKNKSDFFIKNGLA